MMNELVERLVHSDKVSIYTYKIMRDLHIEEFKDAKNELVSQLYEAVLIYLKNHDIDDDYNDIEKYVFKKAYQLVKDDYLESYGKKRLWSYTEDGNRVKKWEQVNYSYDSKVDDRAFYDDFEIEKNRDVKRILDENFTDSQIEFAQLVLTHSEDEVIKILDIDKKSFDQRLRRFEKACEKKREKYL